MSSARRNLGVTMLVEHGECDARVACDEVDGGLQRRADRAAIRDEYGQRERTAAGSLEALDQIGARTELRTLARYLERRLRTERQPCSPTSRASASTATVRPATQGAQLPARPPATPPSRAGRRAEAGSPSRPRAPGCARPPSARRASAGRSTRRGRRTTVKKRPRERRGEAKLEDRGGIGGKRQAGDHACRKPQLETHDRGQCYDARARPAEAERGECVAAVPGSGELGERCAGQGAAEGDA